MPATIIPTFGLPSGGPAVRLFRKVLALLLFASALLAPASGAEYITRTYQFNASGFPDGPETVVTGSFTVTFDFTANSEDQTSDITLNRLSIPYDGPLRYSFSTSDQILRIGSGNTVRGVVNGANDFEVVISNSAENFGSGTVTSFSFARSGTPGVFTARTTFNPANVVGGRVNGGNFVPGSEGTSNPGNNWPGGESPGKAADGDVDTKFLMFQNSGVGIGINPENGIVGYNRLAITTANDSPERDPISYQIYGHSSAISPTSSITLSAMTLIQQGTLALSDNRKSGPAIVQFSGGDYMGYLVVFPAVKSTSGNNITQIAEVQLLKGWATPDKIKMGKARGGLLTSNVFSLGSVGTANPGNNWPAGESPDHALDGSANSKWLMFQNSNAGIIASPEAGPAAVSSLSFWTADDAEERDPVNFKVYGCTNPVTQFTGDISLTAGNGWSLVADTTSVALPATRKSGPVTVEFPNTTPYASYLVVFPVLKNNSTAHTQIAEVAFGILEADYVIDTSIGGVNQFNEKNLNDTLTVSEPAPGQILFSAPGRTFSVNGAPMTTGSSGPIAILPSSNPIIVRGGSLIKMGAFTPPLLSLEFYAGTGGGTVQFTGNCTLLPDATLKATATSIIVDPGVALAVSGTGTVTFTASRSVVMDTGSTVEVEDGALRVLANQDNLSTGNFNGITLLGTLRSRGNGNITLLGRGGPGALSLAGVAMSNATILSPNFGRVEITGIMADGSSSSSHGIVMQGSTITTGLRGFYIEGTAGSGVGDVNNPASAGILLDQTTIYGEGRSDQTFIMTGVAGTSNSSGSSMGVFLRNNSAITVKNSDLNLRGTGGNAPGAGQSSLGINLFNSSIASTGDGFLRLFGTGQTAAANSVGVILAGTTSSLTGSGSGSLFSGEIICEGSAGSAGAASRGFVLNSGGNRIAHTGTGGVTLTGTASQATNAGAFSQGVRIDGPVSTISRVVSISGTSTNTAAGSIVNAGVSVRNASITTAGGGLYIDGNAGAPNTAGNASPGVQIRSGTVLDAGNGIIRLSGTADHSPGNEAIAIAPTGTATLLGTSITLTADSINLHPANATLNAGAGPVILQPKTSGRPITLGAADSATLLGLTDAELDRIAAGSVTIGSPTSGPVTISEIISPASYRILALAKDTHFDAASGFAGDVTSGTAYEKMRVTGTVTITAGATLALSSAGGYTWNGTDAFTLLENDATDAITGAFSGPALAGFLGSALPATQSYTAGTGNDLVVGNPGAPTFAGYAHLTVKNTAAQIPVASILARAATTGGGALSLTAAAAASTRGGSISLAGANVSYTPPANFTGLDSFFVTISDGLGGTVQGRVTVTVSPASGQPAAPAQMTLQPNGSADLLFLLSPGQPYLVQRSTTLQDWTTIQLLTAAPDGTLPCTDTTAPGPRAFYRTIPSAE